jgi:hypothetical protein
MRADHSRDSINWPDWAAGLALRAPLLVTREKSLREMRIFKLASPAEQRPNVESVIARCERISDGQEHLRYPKVHA